MLMAGALPAALLAASGALAAPEQPIVVQGLECRGDEGGWRLDATRTTGQFSSTVPRKREIVFRGALQVLSSPTAIVWRGDSTHLPRETLVLTARDAACRTPIPGAYRALMSIRAGEATTGCCIVRAGYDARVAPVFASAGRPAEDWTRALPDLLPAINACVARAGPRLKGVTQAAASGATARVRMVEVGGNAVECTVDASGRGTPVLTPAGATEATPAGAGNALFYPPREPPPIVACGRLERVLAPRGAVAGYVHFDPC